MSDRARAVMSDRAVIVLAAAVWAGAWVSAAIPVAAAAVVVASGLVGRRPTVLILGAFLLASALGARAWSGLAPPPPGPVAGEVTLLGDPVDVDGAVRVDVRLGARRVEAWARGAAAAAVRPRLAGERVELAGRLRPPSEAARPWLARRHVSARLSVDEVASWRPGGVLPRVANGLRRTLVAGAEPLGPERRALFLGMVVGDDRDQTVASADRFRAAGLTHLLAVSGQNVAFVLALAGPGLSRLGLRGRWAATLAVIGFFGLLTRFEPSVLRAAAMAGVACTATAMGRPASRLRILALAVAGVVLVDPLLIGSVGFQLSVGACAGIVLLAPALARGLPGPRWLAAPLAVTLAAQVGVTPVLVPVFGGLPVASLPANLLAVPAAGPLMAWGLTAGLVAGLLGEAAAGVLHLPTSVLVGWVEAVAGWAAGLSLGQLRVPHVVVLSAVVAACALARHHRLVLPLGAGAAVLVVLAPTLAPGGRLDDVAVADGARLWRAGAVVVVIDDADPSRLLDGLRREGVGRIDVVVAMRGTRTVGGTVATLRERLPVRLVLAPRGHRVRDAQVPEAGSALTAGDLVVEVAAVSPRLEVDVGYRRDSR